MISWTVTSWTLISWTRHSWARHSWTRHSWTSESLSLPFDVLVPARASFQGYASGVMRRACILPVSPISPRNLTASNLCFSDESSLINLVIFSPNCLRVGPLPLFITLTASNLCSSDESSWMNLVVFILNCLRVCPLPLFIIPTASNLCFSDESSWMNLVVFIPNCLRVCPLPLCHHPTLMPARMGEIACTLCALLGGPGYDI